MKASRSVACVAIAAFASVCGVSSVCAAENAVWAAYPMDGDAEMISREGASVYAFASTGNGTSSAAGEFVLNGTAFTTFANFGNKPSSLKISFSLNPSFTMTGSGWGTVGLADPSYAQMISTGWWFRGGTETTVKVKDLEVGTNYLLQIVFHKETANHSGAIRVSAPGEEGPSVYCEGPDWPYGGTLICRFRATDVTESFTLAYDDPGSHHDMLINAIQVRNLDAQSIAPKIGTVEAEVSGTTASVSVSGILLGTDHEGNEASSYDLSYSLNGGASVSVGSALTAGSTSFDIVGLADGSYDCVVQVLTDRNETATNSVRFAINTSIRWKAKTLGETEDAIETRGVLVYAYARTNSVVNTVPFEGLGDVNLDTSSMQGYDKAKFYMNRTLYPQKPASTSPDDYVKMQENYWRGNIDGDGLVTMQLKDLKPGERYLVQIVCSLQEDYASGAQVTTPDGQVAKANGTGWEHGGSLVGIFNAADTTKSFALTFSRYVVFNAIQVRKLPQAFIIRLR